jgi:hypothetical protein
MRGAYIQVRRFTSPIVLSSCASYCPLRCGGLSQPGLRDGCAWALQGVLRRSSLTTGPQSSWLQGASCVRNTLLSRCLRAHGSMASLRICLWLLYQEECICTMRSSTSRPRKTMLRRPCLGRNPYLDWATIVDCGDAPLTVLVSRIKLCFCLAEDCGLICKLKTDVLS